MEPKQAGVGGARERAPVQTGEFLPVAPGEQLGVNPEVVAERAPEVGAVQAEVAQIAMPALPTPVVPVNDDGAGAAVGSDDGLVAADVDLIEKEWVDKAKKIIASTKDDPYRREQEISKLQIEYVRKRYGRVIGDSGD